MIFFLPELTHSSQTMNTTLLFPQFRNILFKEEGDDDGYGDDYSNNNDIDNNNDDNNTKDQAILSSSFMEENKLYYYLLPVLSSAHLKRCSGLHMWDLSFYHCQGWE